MKIRKTNGTLSMGQNSKFPAIALGLSLAMAAPTFGGDIVGLQTIQAGYSGLVGTTYTNNNARLAPNSGDTTTIVITDGYTFSSNGETRFGEKGAAATITVEVGGILNMASECHWNEDGASTQSNRLNVYGTAYVEQLKMYGRADDDIATVGNGTDAATLTILEGELGKEGDAHITINDLSTMIVTKTWGYTIDSGLGSNTGAYINLVGSGTLKVNVGVTASLYNLSIQGNGVLGDWVMTTEVIDLVTYNVYTAVSAPAADPEITSIVKSGNTVTVQFTGTDGETYDLNKATGLDGTFPDNPDSTPTDTTLSGTTTGTLIDIGATEDAAFYQVKQQP